MYLKSTPFLPNCRRVHKMEEDIMKLYLVGLQILEMRKFTEIDYIDQMIIGKIKTDRLKEIETAVQKFKYLRIIINSKINLQDEINKNCTTRKIIP